MNVPETWPRCPEATDFFTSIFRQFTAQNSLIETLALRFKEQAGVSLHNLIDHWTLPEGAVSVETLQNLGLVENVRLEGDRVWKHPDARLPHLRFKAKLTAPRLSLLVEDIELFARQNNLPLDSCHGDLDSSYRCAHLSLPQGELMPIIRNGYSGYAPGSLTPEAKTSLMNIRQAFQTRTRTGSESVIIKESQNLFEQAAAEIGRDRATDEFFASERLYYMKRNTAARLQYARQQEIGIGWANHDHHTFRCSRATFRALVNLFHTMGFESREKFYAGAEAGWGAQVFEHPVSRVVIFADVDMAPEELNLDYAITDLPERDTLGTIGLWCALHTSSIAEAGLHHLEAEFDFAATQDQLESAGVGVMAPFTDLPMLKQAFTTAELWPVPAERLQPLLAAGHISPEQAETFATKGAAGSHLEILQRWEGFKGFNQTGISDIILQTDARKAS